ncbi:MAG: hypothetical protein LUO98_07300 [Methanoregula sp.]|nr:hypothetical protein [Methanoregula sp.]
MQYFAFRSRVMAGVVVFLICFACGLLIPAAAGADVSMEAVMGDTIIFHGFSYVGDSVYLFLTGPGLPVNGVMLTDISQRADQGHFTVVDVDDNQEWTYLWKTSRIDSEIDPGTYTVYVTNKPADLSHLGDEKNYKTFSVFLKDSGILKVSISAQHVYTRSPKEQASAPGPASSANITGATTTTTVPLPLETVPAIPEQPPVPTTRAGTGPLVAVTALLCSVCLVSFLKARP